MKDDLNKGGIWPAVKPGSIDDLLLEEFKKDMANAFVIFMQHAERKETAVGKIKKTCSRIMDKLCGLSVIVLLLCSTGCERPAESQSVSVPVHTQMNWSPSTEEDWIDAHMSVESDHFRLASKTEDWLCEKEGWKDRTWCASLGPAQIVFGYWGKTCGFDKPEDAFNLQNARSCAKKVRAHCAKKYVNSDFISSCYNAGGITKRGMIYAGKVRKAYEKLRGAI